MPEATVRCVLAHTAGNPYQVGKIGWLGIARLNAEHRHVLAPQDVEEFSRQLSEDPVNFTSSVFSPLILSSSEQHAAILFAKALGERDSMPIDEALEHFGDVVQDLEEKQLLCKNGSALEVRGRMLAGYLRSRMVEVPPQPPRSAAHRKAGIFLDIENLLDTLPSGMNPKEACEALTRHAVSFGKVVCRWACAHEGNFANPVRIRLEVESAGFNFRPPQAELTRPGLSKKDLADFVLLRCIDEEFEHTQPDVFLIVSGDKGYYEKVDWLLGKGFAVRMVSASHKLAPVYRELAERRLRERLMAGFPDADFFVDDVSGIFGVAAASTRQGAV